MMAPICACRSAGSCARLFVELNLLNEARLWSQPRARDA